MMVVERVLLTGSTLLLLSVLGSKASSRLGIPTLLIFLCVGMLAGSDGIGGIHFDNAIAAQGFGVTALVYILFSGGFSTHWREVRPVVWQGLALSTLGVLITALFVAWAGCYFLSLSWLDGLLLGAIASSTDAAAVFSILKSRGAGLKHRLKPLLEFESGSNDPMAVFLTVALLRLIHTPGQTAIGLLPLFFQQFTLGALLGIAGGLGLKQLVNQSRLEYEGLYPVLVLSAVLFIYAVTAALGGSGFLAVYVCGLILGNTDLLHRGALARFHDGLAWLMQIGMFVCLGLLVYPRQLGPVAGPSLLIALFLMFVARPISVFVSLAFAGVSTREKLLVSWIGLRGAAPIVLATFPLVAGMPEAQQLFNVVFFIVILSIVLQGTTLPLAARLLGLSEPLPKPASSNLELTHTSQEAPTRLERILIPEGCRLVGKTIGEVHLPPDVLVVMIERGEAVVIPRGDTCLQAGDVLVMLADQQKLAEVHRLVAQAIPA